MGFLSARSELAREKRGVLWGLLLILAFCGLFYFIYHRRANPDYEGRIVDRWAGYSQTDQGSQPYFQLRVESDDGRQFDVKVDSSVYQSSRSGMRIKSTSGQVVLVDTEKNSVR